MSWRTKTAKLLVAASLPGAATASGDVPRYRFLKPQQNDPVFSEPPAKKASEDAPFSVVAMAKSDGDSAIKAAEAAGVSGKELETLKDKVTQDVDIFAQAVSEGHDKARENAYGNCMKEEPFGTVHVQGSNFSLVVGKLDKPNRRVVIRKIGDSTYAASEFDGGTDEKNCGAAAQNTGTIIEIDEMSRSKGGASR